MIYFVQGVDGGAIKIGMTKNLRSRLSGLSGEFGVELRVLGVIDDPGLSDSKIHAMFSEHRVVLDGNEYSREWFRDTPAITEFIQKHAKPWTPAPPPISNIEKLPVDRDLAIMARYVAAKRRIPLAQYLTELLKPAVDVDFAKETKRSSSN